MDTIINELKYNNLDILVLTDSKNNIWFNAYDICVILGYIKPRNILNNLVSKKHKQYLKKYFQIINYIQMHNQILFI
jgi:prophage antirepressor-like protein